MSIDSFSGIHRFLSNFFPSPLQLDDGIVWKTAEHAYQAAKTEDAVSWFAIQSAPTPAIAKKLGQMAPLRIDWEHVKDNVMRDVLEAKFRDLTLRWSLVNTWGHELVEGNTWHDQYWGNCICPQHITVPGENRLGKLLMHLRERAAQG